MFIIVDSSGKCQDIASEKSNLSRGRAYSRYREYEIDIPIKIGDRYIKGKVIAKKETIDYESMVLAEIDDMNRKTAISRLKNKGLISPSFRG